MSNASTDHEKELNKLHGKFAELARTSHDGIILRAASPDCTITSMIRSTQLMATATEPAI